MGYVPYVGFATYCRVSVMIHLCLFFLKKKKMVITQDINSFPTGLVLSRGTSNTTLGPWILYAYRHILVVRPWVAHATNKAVTMIPSIHGAFVIKEPLDPKPNIKLNLFDHMINLYNSKLMVVIPTHIDIPCHTRQFNIHRLLYVCFYKLNICIILLFITHYACLVKNR